MSSPSRHAPLRRVGSEVRYGRCCAIRPISGKRASARPNESRGKESHARCGNEEDILIAAEPIKSVRDRNGLRSPCHRSSPKPHSLWRKSSWKRTNSSHRGEPFSRACCKACWSASVVDTACTGHPRARQSRSSATTVALVRTLGGD